LTMLFSRTGFQSEGEPILPSIPIIPNPSLHGSVYPSTTLMNPGHQGGIF
jgi:hypothetical protein